MSARQAGAASLPAALVCLALAWPILAVSAAGPASPKPPVAMTNEDIVRMTGEHLEPAAIVKSIHAAAATRFDLDPEVVIELRRAGVAEVVLEAMRRAAAAQEAPGRGDGSPGDSAVADPVPRVGLTLRLAAPQGKPDAAPEAAAVEAPARDPDGQAITLGFYLMCLDPTHVPDGWMASPLAGVAPRHQLLYFTATPSDPREPAGEPARVRLELPASVPLEIEPGIHTLRLGLVARRGEEWGELAELEARLRVEAGVPVTLNVAVSGRMGGRRTRTSGYSLRLVGSDPPDALKVFTEPEPQGPGSPPPSGPP